MLLGVLALGGVVIAKHVITPNYSKIAALLGKPWTPAIVQSAWKWSRKRGVPFTWVLATIIVESGANPHAAGDAGGESKGLMQVNTSPTAWGPKLRAAGVAPEALYGVDKGIEWGTLAMKTIYAELLKAIGSRRLQTPLDEALRLAYKGPSTVESAIRAGREPTTISWAQEALSRWRAATQRVVAATGTNLAPPKLFV